MYSEIFVNNTSVLLINLEFGLIDEVLNVQLSRLSRLQEQIFKKS